MSGPRPMPLERQKKLGNPHHKTKGTTMTITTETKLTTEPPKGLQEEGQRLWKTLVTFATWISPSDAFTLEMLATYADKRKQLAQELLEEGEVLTGVNGGKYLNPKTNLLLSLDEKTIKLFSMLGLTPTDRTKLGITIESQEIDPITQIRQGSKLQALRDKHSQGRNALN